MTAPNPGSREATEAGCLCPEMDNRRGHGFMWVNAQGDPERMWWISGECPLHGEEATS